MVSFALRALARRGASAAAAALAVSRPPAPSSTHGSGRAWAAAQTGWTRGFSSEGESTSGSAPDAEAKRPSLPPGLVKDDANTLNELFYLMKMGHGLPPIEEVIAYDTEAEERELRRRGEIQKQEDMARSRVQVLDKAGRAYGTGKRKEAIARVWLSPGTGNVSVNQKLFAAHFPSMDLRQQVIMPFITTGTLGQFNVHCLVEGGGPSGQAQAVRHGISKALQAYNPDLRPTLRSVGLLTRDSRVVERKKPGRKKARKSFQWVKR